MTLSPLPSSLSRRARLIALAGLCAAVMAVPSFIRAQDAARTSAEADAGGQAAAAKPAPPKPAEEPASPAARREERVRERPRLMANVKVDVTITDQQIAGKPTVKTLSAIMGDDQNAELRTTVQVPMPMVGETSDRKAPPIWRMGRLPLNIDLSSMVMEDRTHVLVRLALNYGTGTLLNPTDTEPLLYSAEITQKFSIYLENGKPVVISQSADAATDRKVTIELKATILK